MTRPSTGRTTVKVEPEEELTPRERKDVVADVNLFLALRNQLGRNDLRTLRQELWNADPDRVRAVPDQPGVAPGRVRDGL